MGKNMYHEKETRMIQGERIDGLDRVRTITSSYY